MLSITHAGIVKAPPPSACIPAKPVVVNRLHELTKKVPLEAHRVLSGFFLENLQEHIQESLLALVPLEVVNLFRSSEWNIHNWSWNEANGHIQMYLFLFFETRGVELSFKHPNCWCVLPGVLAPKIEDLRAEICRESGVNIERWYDGCRKIN